MFVKSLLKYLFTWWNGNTVGTKLYTFLKGKKVGEDYLGNSYFESKNLESRWCIYRDQSEASRISPEWNSWLRYISNAVPTSDNVKYEWQKRFDGNVKILPIACKGRKAKTNETASRKTEGQHDLETFTCLYHTYM